MRIDKLWRRALLPPLSLPDHDVNVLKVTPTSGPWKHTYTCRLCRSPVGHQEFMTSICLSCGRNMGGLPYSGAMRTIVKNNKWIDTIRIHNAEYKKVDGEWTAIAP